MEVLLLVVGALLGYLGRVLQQWFTERAAHRERQRLLLADIQRTLSAHLDAKVDHLREISRQLNEAPGSGRDPYVIVHLMTTASPDFDAFNRQADDLLLKIGQVVSDKVRATLQGIVGDSRTTFAEVPKGENPRLYRYFDWLDAWSQRLDSGRRSLRDEIAEAIRALDRPR